MALVRHRDFGGPSWLWSALEKQSKIEPDPSGIVAPVTYGNNMFGVEVYNDFYAEWSDPDADENLLMDWYPACYTAVKMYQNNAPSSFKWIVEAMILAKATAEDISKELADEESPATIRAYKDMFFNIGNNIKRPIWLQKYLWTPAAANQTLCYVNLIYKMTAFFGGRERLGALFNACMPEPEDNAWFRQMVEGERLRHALQSTANYAKLDVCGKMQVTENVVSGWRDEKRNKDTAEDTDASMDRLASAVGAQMSILGLKLKMDAKEIITVDMYTDEDIKNANNE